MTAMPTIKVSVIVATYRPGNGLDDLVASLDAQSLPRDEWEVIFVDDGSPDDTWERLRRIQATRPNVRIERIENSGWACRPRNVGTDLARGEYVAYMDHDDELYPDALRDAYAFAVAHGADALNGKEARTTDPGWALTAFEEDAPQVLDRAGQFALSPTNPHKLYRREFLNEHGIRFLDEGRVLWEDVFFNVRVAKHARVISTMASTPYYHWRTREGSGSTSFLRAEREWWDWLERMIAAIDEDLAGTRLAAQRRSLMEHQYRTRLMQSFDNRYAPRAADEKRMIFERARRIQAQHFAEEHDLVLGQSMRMRAALLRKGYAHLLERLTIDDPILPAHAWIDSATWSDDGFLDVRASARWNDADGRGLRLRRENGRFVKDLDARYRNVVDPDLLDVTGEIGAARMGLLIRSVDTRLAWMVPSESASWIAPAGTDWGVRGEGRIDPVSGAFGAPLERGVWELGARCSLAEVHHVRLARSHSLTPAIRFDQSGVAAVYARPDGVVVLDFDQTGSPLTQLIRPTGRVARVGDRLRIGVAGLPVEQDRRVETMIEIDEDGALQRVRPLPRRMMQRLLRTGSGSSSRWTRRPAVLVIERGRAYVELAAPRAAAAHVRLGDRVPGAPAVHRLRREGGRVRPVPALLRRLLG